MPFHVELSSGIKHARSFNLSREQLMAEVIAPWLEDLPFSQVLPSASDLSFAGTNHAIPAGSQLQVGGSSATLSELPFRIE